MTDALSALVDLELERLILGQMLAFGAYPSFETHGLSRDLFAREEHALVFDAIQAIHDAGGVADLVTTGQALRGDGHLERVGTPYFSRLTDGVPNPAPANVVLEIARLQELAAGRLAYYAAKRLEGLLQTPGAVADGALTNHLDTVQRIVEGQRGPGAAWLDVEGQLAARTRDVLEARSGRRVLLGLPSLDDAIGGIRAGEVCGLMGRPGIGKTVFLCQIAWLVAQQHGHVFCSLEMPGSQIVGRLQQMLYGLGRHQLEDRGDRLDPEHYRATFQHLVLVDQPGLSVAEIGRRVRQIQRGPLTRTPIGLITIDHLGLIGGDRGVSTYDRVSLQAREIKELAKRFECAVLLAIQVNRDAGGDGSKELGLGSARDSGVVEEAMDYLIGIRRLDRSLTLAPFEREKYRDVIFAKVIKNRHGDPGTSEIAYRFFPVGLRLEEDTRMRAQDEDITRIAQARSGGRR